MFDHVLDGDRNDLADGVYSSLIGRGTHDRPQAMQVGASTPKPPKPRGEVAPPKARVAKPKPPRFTTVNVVVNNG